MCVSRFASENDLGRAMTYLAQRWCGASTPVNMLRVNDLRLLLPLNGAAPQTTHMFYELRSQGYFLAIGWRCEPPARGDATIYDMVVGAAGGDDTGLSDDQLASFQKWRRTARVMWVSKLLQAGGRTQRAKFHGELLRRAQNLEVEAMRLCTVAYGHGRTAPGHRRRVGLPTCAAWDARGVGDMVWREGAVCVIVRRDAESARVRVLGMLLCDFTAPTSVHAFSGNDTHDVTFTVPPIRVDTATDAGGGVVHVTTREVTMLRGVELDMLGLGSGSSSGESEQRDHDGDMPLQRTSRVGQSQVGTSEAGQDRAEPSGAERSRAERVRAEQSCGVASVAGRSSAKPSGAERTRAGLRSARMLLQRAQRRGVFLTLITLR